VAYLIVEASWTVDLSNVERAARRAGCLAKSGLLVLPVVAGEMVRPSAAELARKLGVWQATDSYEIVAPLVGPNGQKRWLRSIWMIRNGESVARFITLIPEKQP